MVCRGRCRWFCWFFMLMIMMMLPNRNCVCHCVFRVLYIAANDLATDIQLSLTILRTLARSLECVCVCVCVWSVFYIHTARSIVTNVTNGDETITRKLYKLFLYPRSVLFTLLFFHPTPQHRFVTYLFIWRFLFCWNM